MSLLRSLEVIAGKSRIEEPQYDHLCLLALLSKHSICTELLLQISPTEMSLFSRIEIGEVLCFDRADLDVVGLKVNGKILKVENV